MVAYDTNKLVLDGQIARIVINVDQFIICLGIIDGEEINQFPDKMLLLQIIDE